MNFCTFLLRTYQNLVERWIPETYWYCLEIIDKCIVWEFCFYLFIWDLLLRYSYNTWEVTNCYNNQFTTISLWLFLYVRVKHVKVSAVKNKYHSFENNTHIKNCVLATPSVVAFNGVLVNFLCQSNYRGMFKHS